jgi:hypothetical protein
VESFRQVRVLWPASFSKNKRWKIEEEQSSSSPALRVQGKKKTQNAIQNGTVSGFLFFYEQWMKRRRFGQNAPFQLKGNGGKIVSKSKSSLQFVICSIKSSIAILILKINSIASLLNSIVSPEVGCLFHFSPWSLIYAI